MQFTPEQSQTILDHIPLFAKDFNTTKLICNSGAIHLKYSGCDSCPLSYKPQKCLAHADFHPQVRELLSINHPELLI